MEPRPPRNSYHFLPKETQKKTKNSKSETLFISSRNPTESLFMGFYRQ